MQGNVQIKNNYGTLNEWLSIKESQIPNVLFVTCNKIIYRRAAEIKQNKKTCFVAELAMEFLAEKRNDARFVEH